MSGANERDLRALAYLATRLRTETMGAGKWDDNGIWPILKKLEGQNLAVVIERVTRHAADPEAKTPGAILRPFVPGPAEESRHPYPMRAGDPNECRTHKGQRIGYCGPCASEAAPDPTYGIEGAAKVAAAPNEPQTHAYAGLSGRELFDVKRQELDLKHALEPKTETKEEADGTHAANR